MGRCEVDVRSVTPDEISVDGWLFITDNMAETGTGTAIGLRTR